MRKENRNILLFVSLWSVLVILLFLHTSGRVDIPWFRFTQAKGNLNHMGFHKNYTLLSLRDQIIAIPPGSPVIHPKRKKLTLKYGYLIGRSLDEARRMIDKQSEALSERLTLVEKNFQGYDIYQLGAKLVALSTIDSETGNPVKAISPYSEFEVGKSLDEAKKRISQRSDVP